MSRVNPNPAACCTCTRRSESCASAAASLVREPASEQRTKSKLAFTRYCYCQKLYGVWHTNGRSEGGRILPNSRAIVFGLTQCRRRGARMASQGMTAASSGTHTRWCRKQASSLALSSAPAMRVRGLAWRSGAPDMRVRDATGGGPRRYRQGSP